MNSNGLHHQEHSGDSDSDDQASDSSPHAAYYHPISSSTADSDDDDDIYSAEESDNAGSNAANPIQQNGFFVPDHAEDGMAALDLNGFGVDGGDLVEAHQEEEEEEEEIVREREASISRAFREDDNRRSAPLAPETAARVVEAMRGVAFQGLPPDWVERVPEDQWVLQLQALRGEPSSTRS